MRPLWCSGCGKIRAVSELLAFWPIADASRIRYVCRPSISVPEASRCFRDIVAPRAEVAIALAQDVVEAAA